MNTVRIRIFCGTSCYHAVPGTPSPHGKAAPTRASAFANERSNVEVGERLAGLDLERLDLMECGRRRKLGLDCQELGLDLLELGLVGAGAAFVVSRGCLEVDGGRTPGCGSGRATTLRGCARRGARRTRLRFERLQARSACGRARLSPTSRDLAGPPTKKIHLPKKAGTAAARAHYVLHFYSE